MCWAEVFSTVIVHLLILLRPQVVCWANISSTVIVHLLSTRCHNGYKYRPSYVYPECCEARGVALKCRAACSFDIDLSVLTSTLSNPLECVHDLPAIILCGAGNSHPLSFRGHLIRSLYGSSQILTMPPNVNNTMCYRDWYFGHHLVFQ